MPMFFNSYWVPTKPAQKKIVDECEVTSLWYNFRGNLIATGAANGTLKLWDSLYGSEFKRLNSFKEAILALTFSTDNQNLIAWYADWTIRIWTMNSNKPYNNFHGHSDWINCCSFSHSSNSLITGSSDRQIKLWDIVKGFCTKSFSGLSTWLSLDSVQYGSLFASGHKDGTVKLWTPNTKNWVKQIEVHESGITSVNFTSEGRYLMTTSQDHEIKLIDVKRFEEISMFEHDSYTNGCNTLT